MPSDGFDAFLSEALRSLLVVTISRFFRNANVFHILSREILPRLAEKSQPVAWSAGCASGEEPYSVRIAWEELSVEKPGLALFASDVDPVSLERAEEGGYLVIGRTESLPLEAVALFEPVVPDGRIYRLRQAR
ncbi:MAG: CheR family methyltransferase [Candidatus Deferrimicrobium sp.]